MGLPRLIYGTLGLERLDRERAERLVHAALDHGLHAFDTAPLYGLGAVEELLGKALRGHRQRCVLLGKCGIVWSGDHGEVLFESDVAGTRRVFRKNGLPSSIRAEVHASLERLGVDCIDVMQVHQLDASVPLSDTLGELSRLRQEGKLRHIGVSNFPRSALRDAFAHLDRSSPQPGVNVVKPPAPGIDGAGGLFCVQDEYNALAQSRQPVLDFARDHGVRFLAYSPLAGGLLAGRYGAGAALPDDHRSESPWFEPGAIRRLEGVLTGIGRAIAERSGSSVGQLSLCWLLSRPGVSAAIVGGSSEAQIADNAGALDKAPESGDLEAFGAGLARAGLVGQPKTIERLGGRARELWRRLRK